MNRRNWISGGAAVIYLCTVGCMSPNVPKPLPKADAAVQTEKFSPLAFDDAWNRTLAFASRDGMKIVTADKPSGLITFVSAKAGGGSRLYYNVLLRPSSTGSGTTLVVFARTAYGAAFDTTILDRLSRGFTN